VRKLRVETLQAHEPMASSPEWRTVQDHLDTAIRAVVWPPGSDSFTINPVPEIVKDSTGKERKVRNGVVPIKNGFVESLANAGWFGQQRSVPTVGRVDAAWTSNVGTFAIEWETGNISSSHRSLNRLALGLLRGSIVGGVLVLPSRLLYNCLTDRVGNFQELEPYFEIWQKLPLNAGMLVVIEVEYDATDSSIPLIRRGTDGMSLVRRGLVPGG
jgi:hypothetical protein